MTAGRTTGERIAYLEGRVHEQSLRITALTDRIARIEQRLRGITINPTTDEENR